MRSLFLSALLALALLGSARAQPDEPAPRRPREGLLAVLPARSQGQVGWLGARTRPGTQALEGLLKLDGEALGARLRRAGAEDLLYLLVEGVWTERFPGYMDPNEHALEHYGLRVERMQRDHADSGFDTDQGTEANARAIRDVILAQPPGRRVVLVGHSKGANDAAAAVSMFPELVPRVRGLVAIQAPFAGSALAEDVLGTRIISVLATRFIEDAFGGDARSLSDLSYGTRRAFLARYPYPVGLPTVSVGSTFGRTNLERLDERLHGALLWPAANYMLARYGTPCDGLVTLDDAKIPGSIFVELRSAEHGDTVFQGGIGFPPRPPLHDPSPLTPALVLLLLEQTPRGVLDCALGEGAPGAGPALPACLPDRDEVDRRFYASWVAYLAGVELADLTSAQRQALRAAPAWSQGQDAAGVLAAAPAPIRRRLARGLEGARHSHPYPRLSPAERARLGGEGLRAALEQAAHSPAGQLRAPLTLRRQARADGDALVELPAGAWVRLDEQLEDAGGGSWYRVQTRRGIPGYLPASGLQAQAGLAQALGH